MNLSRIVEESFHIVNSDGDPLHVDLRYPAGMAGLSLVVICHSFMAFKDWGFFPYVAGRIADAGFASISFNFSLNGVVDHGDRITEFDRFRQNTFSRELSDLSAIIDAIDNRAIGAGTIDPSRICLMGHSRGGGVAIVHSASDPRIKALLTWSAISTFDRWTPHQKENWKRLGNLALARDSTISPLRLGIGLLHDLENHRKKLDIVEAASRIRIPWLLLHGRADVTVPLREAELLYDSADKKLTSLAFFDGLGHLYNGASPREDGYMTLDKILEVSRRWLQKNLS